MILSYRGNTGNSSNGLFKLIEGKLTKYLSFKDGYLARNDVYDMNHRIIYVDEINNGSIYSIRNISTLQIAVDVVYNIKSESFVYDSCIIELKGPNSGNYQFQLANLYHCKSSNRVTVSIVYSLRKDYAKKYIRIFDVTDVNHEMEVYTWSWSTDKEDNENNAIFTVR